MFVGYVIAHLKIAKNNYIIDKILFDACKKNFRYKDYELEHLYKVTSILKHFKTPSNIISPTFHVLLNIQTDRRLLM